MGTITSAGSGNWGTGATWVGGSVPANGDAVVIADGHAIVFNVDQSGVAAGIAGLTLGAGSTLTASTSAGAYYLKMAGNITASGAGAELRAGTAGTAYPSNCTFTIYMNGNYSIDGGASNTLTCKFYCYDPPVKYLRLISATPKAITGISKANPCTVTCVGHGKSGGDIIYLVNVGGMVELNNLRVRVKTVLTADTFTLRAYDADVEIDSTYFTTYTSGGYVCPETAEAAAQTVLEVDQDVSADAEWTRSGATVNIDNVARAANSEARTIASVAAGNVTVTAGLTAAKHSSSLVILTSRNVTLQSSSTNINNGIIYRGSGHVLRCAIKAGNTSTHALSTAASSELAGVCSGCNYVFYQCDNNTISGTITGCNTASYASNTIIFTSTAVVSGCTSAAYYGYGIAVAGKVSGCGNIFYLSYNANLTGSIIGCAYATRSASRINIYGIVSGCTRAINSTDTVTLSGSIIGCNSAIDTSNVMAYNAVLSANGADVDTGSIYSFNSCFSSSIENRNYASSSESADKYSYSIDHDATAGAFRAWTRGGVTSSTATDPPTGRVRSYQTVCESATYPGWYQREIVVDAGRQLRLRVWLKADAGVEIKAQLVLPTADPLVTGTGTGEWQQIGTSDGTWHEYVTSWTNSATYPVTIYARVLSTAESGNGYSDMMWAFDRTPLVR